MSAVTNIRSEFGGMGSFSDLFLAEQNGHCGGADILNGANQWLEGMRSALYAVVTPQ
jgi:hypothetical protein